MTKSKIARKDFYEINRKIRELKLEGTYNAEKVAQQFGVGASTVRTIARCKTYPAFERYKANRRLVRRQREEAQAPAAQAPAQETEQTDFLEESKQTTLDDYQAQFEETPIERAVGDNEPVSHTIIDSLIKRIQSLEEWRKTRMEAEKGLIQLQMADAARISTASRGERARRAWRNLINRGGKR